MDQEPTMNDQAQAEATTLFALARYIDVAARSHVDDPELIMDLGNFAGAARDIGGMLRATSRTLDELTSRRKEELETSVTVPDGKGGIHVVPSKDPVLSTEDFVRVLGGIRALPDDSPVLEAFADAVESVKATDKPGAHRYPESVSIPGIDGATVQVIPVYEPDAIPPEILRDGIPESHITGHQNAPRYSLRHLGNDYDVWDRTLNMQAKRPDGTLLLSLTRADAITWRDKLNAEAGHDTPTDNTTGTH